MVTYHDFRIFLQKNNCEEAFDHAFYDYNGSIAFDKYMWDVSEAAYIIAHAFDWAATPEGRKYWLEIDRRWHNIYSNKNKNEDKRKYRKGTRIDSYQTEKQM